MKERKGGEGQRKGEKGEKQKKIEIEGSVRKREKSGIEREDGGKMREKVEW